MDKAIIELYSQQGGSIPFYEGFPRYQVGGSFLGGLMRFALPLIKKLGTSALQIAANTAEDVVTNNRPMKEAIFKNTKREFKRKMNDDETIYKQNKTKKRRLR